MISPLGDSLCWMGPTLNILVIIRNNWAYLVHYNTEWSCPQNPDIGRDRQDLPSHSLDTCLYRWVSWKRNTEWRMWHLHQTAKQAYHFHSNPMWRPMFKLSGRGQSTSHSYWVNNPAWDKKVVFLTDSLSVLQSIASGNAEDYTLRNLVNNVNNLSTQTTTVLQWTAWQWSGRQASERRQDSNQSPSWATERPKH